MLSCRIQTFDQTHSEYAHKDIQWPLTRECKSTQDEEAHALTLRICPTPASVPASPGSRPARRVTTRLLVGTGTRGLSRRQFTRREMLLPPRGAKLEPEPATPRGGAAGVATGTATAQAPAMDATGEQLDGKRARRSATLCYPIQIRLGQWAATVFSSRPKPLFSPIAK